MAGTTPVPVQPIVLRDVLVTIDGHQFERAVSSVALTPSASVVTWQGGTPDSQFTDVSPATWAAGITHAQDWENEDSLSNYLFDHEGETVDATFAPKNGGQAFDARVVITPGAIGGAIGSTAEATVTLGVQGRPKRATAAPA